MTLQKRGQASFSLCPCRFECRLFSFQGSTPFPLIDSSSLLSIAESIRRHDNCRNTSSDYSSGSKRSKTRVVSKRGRVRQTGDLKLMKEESKGESLRTSTDFDISFGQLKIQPNGFDGEEPQKSRADSLSRELNCAITCSRSNCGESASLATESSAHSKCSLPGGMPPNSNLNLCLQAIDHEDASAEMMVPRLYLDALEVSYLKSTFQIIKWPFMAVAHGETCTIELVNNF